MSSCTSIDQEVAKLSSYFISQSFNITHEWLYGCVQYFRSENPRCTESEIKECVRKQWELSDLRDSSSGCLPNNLNSHKKITLRGKYALQIESVINIGMSAYSQIQKMRKVDSENVELTETKPESWEPKLKRMLKMNLCDGPHTVEAIEYRPLPMLSEQITPGTKIMIIGPVDCRRGCFFLKPENLKIIGGEIDSILITNNVENVLARILNLPENEDPYSNQAQPTGPPRNVTELPSQTNPAHTFSTNVEIPHHRPVNQVSTFGSLRVGQNYHTNNTPVLKKEEEVLSEVVDLDVSGWEDDDLFVDESTLLEIEETALTTSIQMNVKESRSGNLKSSCNGTAVSKQKFPLDNSNLIVPQKRAKTAFNETDSSATNTHNSFLASDEYVDAMLELEEEEMMNEFSCSMSSNVTGPSSSKNDFKTTTSVTSTNMSSKVENYSSHNSLANKIQRGQAVFKKPDNLNFPNYNQNSPVSSHKQKFTERVDSVIQAQPNDQVPSSPSRGQQLLKKPETVTTGQSRSTSISSWSSSSSSSSSAVSHMPSKSFKSSGLNSKSSIDKKACESIDSKVSNCSKGFASISDTVNDEEDWADAYLSTKNFSFMSQFNGVEETKTASVRGQQPTSFPPTFNKSSEGQGARKQSTSLLTHSDKVLDNKPDIARSFQKAQAHLPAAFCSPNDFNDKVDVTLIPSDDMSLETSTPSKFSSISKTISPNLDSGSSNIAGVKNSVQPWTCPIKTPEPFEYLLHVLHSPTKKCGIHKFKATILTLLSQLSIDKERGWILTAKVADGSASLDVQFSSEVLEEMIGLCPKEFKQLKREVPKNPLMKDKLLQVLKKSQQKLVDLNCIFSIKFEDNKIPTVINISDVTQQDATKLKLRVANK